MQWPAVQVLEQVEVVSQRYQRYSCWYHSFEIIVDRVLLVVCSEVSVLIRKYETKAQTYENPDEKSEN